MTEQTPTQAENLRKKLQKREQLILKRLKGAQQAHTKALKRYHRAEGLVQKRMDRIQHIEESLILVRQQLDELNQTPSTSTVAPEIPTWAQPITASSPDIHETESITEPTEFATEARTAAEAAEENIRLAAARVSDSFARPKPCARLLWSGRGVCLGRVFVRGPGLDLLFPAHSHHLADSAYMASDSRNWPAAWAFQANCHSRS